MSVASRADTSSGLDRHVKKLGNPVLYAHSDGRVWLYYVAVSFGGWSGSFIATKVSDDGGQTWSEPHRLVTSPFINISTLVRAPPRESKDGHILLPVYHEFLKKFGELLWLSSSGRLISKTRMTQQTGLLQPWLVPVDSDRCLAFYRQSGLAVRKVMMNEALTAAGPWNPVRETNVPNPNSSSAVVRRSGGGLLMVGNPTEFGRNRLSIAVSGDGVQWDLVHDLENGSEGERFSYPYIIQTSDGRYHVIYTWKRTRMKLVSFNDAWLESLP